jgi:hypothetical protein
MRLRHLLLTLLLIATTALIPASLAFGDGGGGSGSNSNGGHGRDDQDNGSSQATDKPAATTTQPSTTASADQRPTLVSLDGLPPAGPPVLGKAVAVGPVNGTVRVRLPGTSSFVILSRPAQVPTGAVLDTTNGTVSLTAARNAQGSVQSAAFTGATFLVAQARKTRPVTDLVLRGGDFGGCRNAGASHRFAVAARSPVRRLWGSGHGRFRTRGRYGAATVRGTTWLTEDRCEGTRVRVVRGRVAVRDMVRHRTVMVSAGHAHLVRARR